MWEKPQDLLSSQPKARVMALILPVWLALVAWGSGLHLLLYSRRCRLSGHSAASYQYRLHSAHCTLHYKTEEGLQC